MNCTESLLSCSQALLEVGKGVIQLEDTIKANGLMIILLLVIVIGLVIMIVKNNDRLIKLEKKVKA